MALSQERRRIAAFLNCIQRSSLLLLFAFISCHHSAGPPVIALITPLTTSDMWKGMHAGVYKSCAEQGCIRYWNAPTHEHDFGRQIALIGQERSRNVTGIILGPSDASALIPAIADARRSGIPLIVVENALSMSLSPDVPTIVSDNSAAGTMGAARIGAALHGHGTVALAGFDPANTPTVIRAASFVSSLRKNFPEIILLRQHFDVASQSQFDELDSEETSKELRSANAIFSLSTYGSRQLLSTVDPHKEKDIPYIVACDEDSDLMDAVRAGEIQAVIVEDTYSMGYAAAQEIMLFHKNGQVPKSFVVKPLMIDSSNIDSAAARAFVKPFSGFDR